MSEGNPLAKGAAWMNGEIMPINEARLPVNDWGILHSDITYDVVPVRDGAFFRLPDYMERFRASRASLRLDIGMDEAAISAALHRMVAASGLRDSYVAMVASRGVPLIPGTRDPRECGNHFYCWCVPYIYLMRPEMPPDARTAWIAKSVTRIPASSVDPRVKNYHWGDFTAGLFEAKDNGFETVILLDANGNVTEGPGFNVFAVSGNRLITPDAGALEGISRRTVIEMGQSHGMDVDIRPLPLAEFMEADEVFLSTSGGGVMPLTRVDDRIFSNGAIGPVAAAMHETYWLWIKDPAYRTEIEYDAKPSA